MTEMHFLLQKTLKNIMHGHVKMTFSLDNIFIRFGTKLYRQVVGIPIDTYCATLVEDLFLFFYERELMIRVSKGAKILFLMISRLMLLMRLTLHPDI